MNDREFSVYAFDPHGYSQKMLRFVDAETAVKEVHRISNSVGCRLGLIVRVIITDGGDFTCFEWKHGHGVTFPAPEQRGVA